MIEIFKTDIRTKAAAQKVIQLLSIKWIDVRVNVDLQDRDKILRIEGIGISDVPAVEMELAGLGFSCEILS